MTQENDRGGRYRGGARGSVPRKGRSNGAGVLRTMIWMTQLKAPQNYRPKSEKE